MATATKTQTEQLEAAQKELAEAAQSQFIASVKAQQKIALDAATVWAEQVSKLYPNAPAVYATQLRAQVKQSSDIYDELFAAHREFTDRLLEVVAPVKAS